MFKNIVLIIAITTFLLAFTGCGEQQVNKIKSEIKEEISEVKEHVKEFRQEFLLEITEKNRLIKADSDELTKELGFPFAQIGFVDSRNGTVVHLIPQETEITFTSDDERIPEYKKITSINVIPITGVIKDAQNKDVPNCNYIHVDASTKLICESANNTEPIIPSLPRNLTDRLEKKLKEVAKAADFKIGFIVATDVTSGEVKVFRHEDYAAINPAFPQSPLSLPELRTPISLYIITEKVNPCCEDVYSSGSWHRVCNRTIPSC